MYDGLKNSSFQYIDIFSEISSNSGLSLDDFQFDHIKQSDDKATMSSLRKKETNDDKADSLIINTADLEPMFNSKLKIAEKQTDLELLKPEGIEATKFNTGILKSKQNKQNNANRKVSYAADFEKPKIADYKQSLDESAKLSSTHLSSSAHTYNTHKIIIDNSTGEIIPPAIRNRLASTPNVISQAKIQFNQGLRMPQPQYYSNTILSRQLPVTQNFNINPISSFYPLYQNQAQYIQNVSYPLQSYQSFCPIILQQPTFSTSNINLYNTIINCPSSESSVSQTTSCSYSTNSVTHDENLISYITSLSQSEDIISYICTQNGCKEVQRRIHRMNGDTANFLLKLISNLKGVEKIMKDSFANYILQKAAELASPNIRVLIFNDIEPHISNLGCDVFGSHCLQKFIQIMNNDTEKNVFIDLISKAAVTLSCNTYGVFIILKALSGFSEKKRSKLNNALLKNLTVLIKDVHGVCVVSLP